jgi:class 3 adenylate cyclase
MEEELQELESPVTPSTTSPVTPLQDSTIQESPFLSQFKEDEEISSLGGSYIGSTDDDATDTSGVDLLRVETDGFCGVLERVPMTFKLVVMCVTSLLGMTALAIILIVFTARDIKEAKFSNEFQQFVSQIRPVILAIQDEREAANNLLKRNDTAVLYPILQEKIAVSKRAFDAVKPVYASFQKKYGDLVKEQLEVMNCVTNVNYDATFCQTLAYRYLQDNIDVVRTKILAMNDPIIPYLIVPFYNQAIYAILELLGKVITAGGANTNANSYVLILRMIEMEQELRLLGSNSVFENKIGPVTLGSQRYRELYKYYRLTQEWTFLFRTSSPPKLVEYYDQSVPAGFATLYLSMQEYMSNRDVEVMGSLRFDRFTLVEWQRNTTQRIDILHKVMAKVESTMTEEASGKLSRSIGIIIAILCIIVFFWILSTFTVVSLSFTIIGPWRRLNLIQQLTLNKFIPQGFLRMIGAQKITDVQLGKHVQKKLTMLSVDIKSFSTLARTLGPDQVFDFINCYLNHVSPIIRKNGGFIDRYQGETFYALFPDTKKGVRASVELQACIELFNARTDHKYPPIALSIGVHTDDVLLGTVGEQERLSGTVLSPSAMTSVRLQRLAAKFNARTCATHIALKQTEKMKLVPKRFIGVIKTEDSQGEDEFTEVYEVMKDSGIDVDTMKITFKGQFEKGVKYFLKGMYEPALQVFNDYMTNKSDDTLAIAYHRKAKKLAQKARSIVSELGTREILMDPILKQGLEDFCKSERSSENIDLYNEIHAFKTIGSNSERTEKARRISRNYFAMDGMYTVNINEQLKRQLNDKVNAGQVDSTLFDTLTLELTILMGDTVKRFKVSPKFVECFGQSSVAPKQPTLDQLQ